MGEWTPEEDPADGYVLVRYKGNERLEEGDDGGGYDGEAMDLTMWEGVV